MFVSKALDGNDVNDEQLYQVLLKSVPLLVSSNGNDVMLDKPRQVLLKLIPLIVSINGNDVNDEQLYQV